MLIATLLFSGLRWLAPALLLFLAGVAATFWGYRSSSLNPIPRWSGILLRTLGFAALAFCLLEPMWAGMRAKEGANYFLIMADNSQGMQIRDRNEKGSETRGETLKKILGDNVPEWQVPLEQDFEVRRYLFDSKLQLTKDFSDLRFDGRSTSLGAALTTIGERFQGRPLAGILLLTDGNATDFGSAAPNTSGLPPIYPVVIGKDQVIKDVSIQKVTVSQTAFEDAPVTIQATIAASGYTDKEIIAQLFDSAGKLVLEQSESAKKEESALSFRFQFKPEKPGLSFYGLRVSAKDDLAQFERPDDSKEATLANNTRMVMVNRGSGPYRVLYVAGRPNWEFKFLNRAVEEDNQVQLSALIRVAPRIPRFEFQVGSDVNNALYKGSKLEGEDAERSDEAVLERLYVNDPEELLHNGKPGFPVVAEDLYKYQAIILGDLESSFFTHDQMSLVQKFVSERGGSLLMLGGVESLTEGNYAQTPIGDMLPVHLDLENPEPMAGASVNPASATGLSPVPPPPQFLFDLDREGWLQPWIRLRKTESDEKSRLEEMPAFGVFNQVGQTKPGASLLATVADPSGKQHAALAVQHFGRGQTAALMIGDLWRWQMESGDANQADLGKFWRQTVRWLTADVPERLTFEVSAGTDASQAMDLQVRVKDKKFLPLDNANVQIRVQQEKGNMPPGFDRPASSAASTETQKEVQLPGEPAVTERGLYASSYVPHEIGAYRAEASVTDADGVVLGKVEAGWTSDPAAEEFASLRPNRPLMAKLAEQTGGKLVEPDQLAEFVKGLSKQKAPMMEPWTVPLWDTRYVFAFALICFIAEWGLRRIKGLA